MDLIEGSETSAIINQTPGNYPKESLLYVLLFQQTRRSMQLQSLNICVALHFGTSTCLNRAVGLIA